MPLLCSVSRLAASSRGLALTLLLSVLLLGACASGAGGSRLQVSSGRKGSPADAASAAGLPAPDALPLPKISRRASYVEADLLKNASDFDPALPHALVATTGSELDFTPSAAGGGNGGGGLSGSAYCVFRFSLSGYDRDARLRASWSQLADNGDIYFGLANWSGKRWDWFRGTAQPQLALPGIDAYLRGDGTVLVAVLCGGSAAQRLTSLRVGSELPVAQLTLTPAAGFVPVDATADGSGSSVADGSIVKYEWDLNGNGVFELDSGSDPSVPLHFDSPGFQNIVLRVTSNTGLSATASAGFSACEEWVHSYGGSSVEAVPHFFYDGRGSIYVQAISSSFGANNSELLLKLDLSGTVVWARQWDGGSNGSPAGIAAGSDGRIVTCGYVQAGSLNHQNAYIQTWSPEGVLLSSRFFDNSFHLFPDAMVCAGNQAYCAVNAGNFNTAGLLSYNIDSAAFSVLAATRSGVDDYFLRSIALSQKLTGTTVYIGGAEWLGSAKLAFVQPFAADLSGTFSIAKANLFSVNNSDASGLLVRGSVLPEVLVCGSLYSTGQVFFSSLKSGSSLQSLWTLDGVLQGANGVMTTPGGGYCTVGNSQSGSSLFCATFDSALANQKTFSLPSNGLGFQAGAGPAALAGAGFLAGGVCTQAEGAAFEEPTGSSSMPLLSWQQLTMDPVSVPSLSLIDLPGTVSNIDSLVVDSGAGSYDLLLLSHSF